MATRKLKVAIAGLGRMGARHAHNFMHRTPRAEVVAAFTPDESEVAWAQRELVPNGCTVYKDYDEMLRHEGLEAVVIATVTTVHAEQAIKAMEAGKHVLCEKPLSTDVEKSQQVVDVAAKHPHLKVMCGFSRRFDDSYREAWEHMDSGALGRPTIVRSQTCDKHDPSPFFVEYSKTSGGIFVDQSIHDIDLALWFFGNDTQVKSVAAMGVAAVHPDLAKYGDVDNGVGIVEFYNGRMAYFYGSRMMATGQHDMTEVIGTKGKVTVNANPQDSLVERHEANGIRKQIPQHYYGRFEFAFVNEANEFTAACLDGKKLPLKLQGAVEAVRIGYYLQEALRTGKRLEFDQTGKRIERANL